MERGQTLVAEFFADLDYSDEGKLIITREHDAKDPEACAGAALRAVAEGRLIGVGGVELPVRADTVCVHSDTPTPSPSPAPSARRCGPISIPDSPKQRRTRTPRPMAQEIVSPLPGTFYRRSAPDQPPFKAEGDVWRKGR
jgi:biotin carboxyl carrier protein